MCVVRRAPRFREAPCRRTGDALRCRGSAAWLVLGEVFEGTRRTEHIVAAAELARATLFAGERRTEVVAFEEAPARGWVSGCLRLSLSCSRGTVRPSPLFGRPSF